MVDLTIGLITGNPAYGGINNYSNVAMSDIDDTPQVIPATAASVDFSQNVVQDFANDALSFGEPGVWNLATSIAFLFDGENFGRQYDVDVFNLTKVEAVLLARVSVGRNQEGSNPSANLLFDVPEASIDDLFQIRVSSSADTFANVTLNFYSFNIVRVDVPRTS